MRRSVYQSKNRIFLVLLTVSLFFSSFSLGFSSELDRQLDEYNSTQSKLNDTQKQLEAAKKQEATLLGQINSLDQNTYALAKEISWLERQLAEVTQARQNTETELVALVQQLDKRTRELEATKVELAEKTRILNNRLENIYKNGQIDYLQVVLGSSNFNDFISRLAFMKLILEQDQRILTHIKSLKAALEIQKAQVESEKNKVEVKRARLVEQENQIASITQTKQAKKAQLEAEKKQKEQLLAQARKNKALYEQAERELQNTSNRILSIIRLLQGGSSGTAPTGQFLWPTAGSVTSGFGMRWHPILGGYRLHNGIDIGAPYGQNIVAAESGTVIFAGWLGGYGQTMIIDHGGGISTLYAHTSQMLAGDGQKVNRGSVIAKVGSTGYSTGPHLHFEVRVNGVPQNPLSWLR